ncbi:NADP-dependent oxidoreductase domain-containing protein [Cadophora sp. MPI-SDFR-AT-0126]|nr:NADP-dependent oxidoreductase domain-containing protein [Leotiomycetes sp. MPI-SDFR-AT-0126]
MAALNSVSICPVALAVGTHNWETTPESEAFQNGVLDAMKLHNVTHLDTARAYGMGASETAIGKKGLSPDFKITTKAPTAPGNGAGSRGNVLKAARASLADLKVEKVSVYLLHGPDETVPVAETYSAIQTLYEEGRFVEFGLSNMTKDQVLEYYNHATTNNLVLPTVFQSAYSPVSRHNETLLFPTLRELGIRIQAYSPLAMGFLAKSPSDFESETKGLSGRWDAGTINGEVHMFMFGKPSFIAMLADWCALAEESGAGKVGLAYRWVRYHSALRGELGDEMIIGASSARQFEEAMREIEKGPLEQWVAERIEGMWDSVRQDAEVDSQRALRVVIMGEGKK